LDRLSLAGGGQGAGCLFTFSVECGILEICHGSWVFFVDSRGICKEWKWKNNSCKADCWFNRAKYGWKNNFRQ
jgi:hypothetical protein